VLAIVGALATAALVVLYRFDPATSPLYPPCVFHELTGLHCAGCGSLRAFHALLHGEWRRALGLNPASVMAVPALAVLVARQVWHRARGSEHSANRAPGWVILAIASGIVLYGVVRNLPGMEWLAP
jgi:hypothetical protein